MLPASRLHYPILNMRTAAYFQPARRRARVKRNPAKPPRWFAPACRMDNGDTRSRSNERAHAATSVPEVLLLVPKLLLGHAHVFEALLRPRGAEARCHCQIAPCEAELRGQVRSQAGACGTRSAGERGQDGVKGGAKPKTSPARMRARP